MTDFVESATYLLTAGFSVIPTGANKVCTLASWKPYQAHLMSTDEAKLHFAKADRLAVIGGKVSGNLECLDFDDPTTYAPFLELLSEYDAILAASLVKLQTPSGGYHLIYRCSGPVAGNLKLAMTEDGKKVKIETRGEGGYFLTAPSIGYSIIGNSILATPSILPAQVEVIHALAGMFDLRERAKQAPFTDRDNSGSPGSDFNKRNPIVSGLIHYGWREDKPTTSGIGWTRPGKIGGTSGVLLNRTGNFYCWSSNAFPLEAGKSYNSFALYTAYEHGGDFKAAARALAGQGYGTAQESTQQETGDDWEPNTQPWPVMDSKAYYGIAGDFVNLASRKSEADPAAILATFLVRFGVECGNAPTLYVGDTSHRARLAGVIVGASSKARKGTSAKPVGKLFKLIDTHARATPGPFSSGEGIIHAVRDQVKKWDEKKQAEVVVDPGVDDKRLFVLDEEFAGVMTHTKREGNTLSMVIRQAWDDGNLDPLTKTSKTTATGAHVGWISHITLQELHHRLNDTEAFNGFANRILWVFARRQQLVAIPEPMPDDELEVIRARVIKALDVTRRGDFLPIRLSTEVKQAWSDRYYADLTKDNPGLVGCVINRAEAQVLRLAMIYCLLDGLDTINMQHLEAALAFWSYCEQSARFIFHGRQEDQTAQKILDALQAGEITGTELFKLFGNNVTRSKLESALSELMASGRVEREVRAGAKGRPATVWKIKIPD